MPFGIQEHWPMRIPALVEFLQACQSNSIQWNMARLSSLRLLSLVASLLGFTRWQLIHF
jgi:hypothetical protein